MPIELQTATSIAKNTIRLKFNESYVADADLYKRNNYAFTIRYGDKIDIYAKEIQVVSASQVDVILWDAALINARYEITVFGVKGVDQQLIENVGSNTAVFTALYGDPLTTFFIKRRVPTWWQTRFGNVTYALLGAAGDTLNDMAGRAVNSAFNEVARAIVLRTAAGEDLTIIGQNYGLKRFTFAITDDDLWRQLIPIYGPGKKAILDVFHRALTVALGDRATGGWGVYETEVNEIDVDVPASLIFGLAPGTLASATYLHDGDGGSSTSVGLNFLTDTSQVWTVNQWDGGTFYLRDSIGSYFVIVSNTIDTLTVTGTPTAGAYTVMAHFPPSYAGDYYLADAASPGTAIDGNIIVLFGNTVLDDLLDPLKASGIVININSFG